MALNNIKFFIQNAGWCTLNPSQALKVHKAMEIYRKANPLCEITGSDKGVQIHHIVPVWADPTIADSQDNFISLSTKANVHHIFGHNGSFGGRYVSNIKEIAQKIRANKKESIIIRRIKSEASISNYSFMKKLWKKIVDSCR